MEYWTIELCEDNKINMNYKNYQQKNKINTSKKDIVFELSNLITEARLYAGISQAELARRIGTQQPSIARAESGELEPSMRFLEKIAEAVGTTFIPPTFSFKQESKSRSRAASKSVSKNPPTPAHSPSYSR